MKRTTCPRPPRHSIPSCPQASYAQQLCRQHIIAGQHILEDLGTQQQTRRWWTLAGQEITVTFNRFMVRSGDWGPEEPQVQGHRSSKGVEVGQSGQGAGMWNLSQRSHFSAEILLQIQRPAPADIHRPQGQLPSS